VLTNSTLTKVVPIFVAVMVWLIRVLVIGTFSAAGERLFSQADARMPQHVSRPAMQPVNSLTTHPRPAMATASFRPTAKAARPESAYARSSEPTYHNLSMSSKQNREAEYLDNPHIS